MNTYYKNVYVGLYIHRFSQKFSHENPLSYNKYFVLLYSINVDSTDSNSQWYDHLFIHEMRTDLAESPNEMDTRRSEQWIDSNAYDSKVF